MKYLKIFTNFLLDVEPLSFEERGRLFTAMLMYAEEGTEPGLIGNERFLWGTAKKQIDTQADAYKKLCDMNKKNRSKRDEPLPSVTDRDEPLRTVTKDYESSQEKEKDKDKEYKERLSIESRKKFVPPTLEEIESYIREQRYTVDAERFLNYYTANGWIVGKSHMKDWRAAVRSWQSREPKRQTAYRNADLERLEVQL